MSKKIKKFIFPGLGIIVSAWLSIVFAFWAIIGFFATDTFVKRYVQTGKVKRLKWTWRDWEIHLHHWLWPGLILIGVYAFDFIHAVPLSILGFTSGVIFQDLYKDKKWYRVINRKS